MKFLVDSMVFILMFSLTAQANWMSEGDIEKKQGGQHGVKVFASKGDCDSYKQAEEQCHEVTGGKVATMSVQEVREGGYESAEDLEPCDDQSDCETKMAAKVCADGTYEKFWGDLDSDEVMETWCARRALVKKLKPDSTLEAAVQAKVQDESSRQTKLQQIRSTVLQCAKADLQAITAAQVAQCMKASAKALMYLEMELKDL